MPRLIHQPDPRLDLSSSGALKKNFIATGQEAMGDKSKDPLRRMLTNWIERGTH
jgi:hypothetical protein